MTNCPSCGATVKGERGLSIHTSRYCRQNTSKFSELLQQRRERIEFLAEQEERRVHFEAEQQAERERREQEQDALRVQRLAEFQSLGFDAPDTIIDVERRPSGLPARRHHLPQRYRDDPPALPIPLPFSLADEPPDHASQEEPDNPDMDVDPTDSENSDPESAPEPDPAPATFRTECDANNVFREYLSGFPSYDPEASASLDHLCDDLVDSPLESGERNRDNRTVPIVPKEYFHPFRNPTTWRLIDWFYNSSTQKSIADLNSLVRNVILADDFDRNDLQDFDARREVKRLDDPPSHASEPTPVSSSSGWHTTSVSIRLPCERVKQAEDTAPQFVVEGLHYRKITDVVKSAFEEVAAESFHIAPYKVFWQPDEARSPERVFTELYTGDAMLQEHETVKSSPPVSGCNLETVIAAIMLWSDSTHLASFGNAALWPVYLFLGNQSKYTRAKPSSFAAHHLAYIPKLSDTIQEFYKKTFGRGATASVLTHCKRELMQAIWTFLLDSDFLEAYRTGLIIKFADGISRRVLLRIFTYAADYPEKILLACIKFLGRCPCPRCLITKDKICKLGSKLDEWVRRKRARVDDQPRRRSIETVRKHIFESGLGVVSKAVERVIGGMSLVPTRNAFSEKLSEFGFNFYSLFVPDLMHEFELGVWKATITHLIRILFEVGDDTVQELNARFRLIPTFGRDTIRKFSSNVSELSKLAARDFEDILQCAIPAFDGLLAEPYNSIILDLLFELATWHAFGKLRMHTETTLFHFKNSTTRLGQIFRKFSRDCCSKFETRDLPREAAARHTQRKGSQKSRVSKPVASETTRTTGSRRARSFNMSTYKLHALGDYVEAIRLYGTSDNYSTQVKGELEHRRVKRFYARTNKINFAHAIAKHQQRERLLHRIEEEHQTARDDEILPPDCPPEDHYQMGNSEKYYWNLDEWIGNNRNDQAFQGFTSKLKCHILGRLLKDNNSEFTPAQRNKLIFIKNRIYCHNTIRINYTTYDLRRAQDLVNPRTHGDVMVLSNEEESDTPHPYWYARVVGIFHVHAQYCGLESRDALVPQRFDFLWVRWVAHNRQMKFGWEERRLPCVGFYSGYDDDAFGFINPDDVIRGVHLIPAFRYGRTSALLGPSITRNKSENNEDWDWYFVNIFADRDMFMRYRGGAVGHNSTRDATKYLLNDRDKLDKQPFVLETEREPCDESMDSDLEDDDGDSDRSMSSDGTSGSSMGEDSDSDSEDEGSESGKKLISNELGDEMEEYGYSGLEQVLEHENSGSDDDQMPGEEDEMVAVGDEYS